MDCISREAVINHICKSKDCYEKDCKGKLYKRCWDIMWVYELPSVIDSIKAEIKTEISDYEGCADFNEGIRFGLQTALEIIEKHQTESEDDII